MLVLPCDIDCTVTVIEVSYFNRRYDVATVVKLAQVSGFRDQETEIGNSKINT